MILSEAEKVEDRSHATHFVRLIDRGKQENAFKYRSLCGKRDLQVHRHVAGGTVAGFHSKELPRKDVLVGLYVTNLFDIDFYVDGFWNAVGGSIVITIVTWVVGLLADITAANRKILEDVQYRVRKIDYAQDAHHKE